MQEPQLKTAKYNTITVEAAEGGWIAKQGNRTAKVFVRWESLIRYLELQLTSKGDAERKP